MTIALRVATAFGLQVCAAAMYMTVAAAQPVQPRITIPEIMPKVEPSKVRPEDLPDIVFYVAKGDANACGHGCDAWIAADGKIDIGAAERLRELLAKLGNRRLPVFFHSPGGAVGGSLELGRMLRSHDLVAGVARTTPRGCNRDNLREPACEAQKRSGSELVSEFDTDTTICHSGCVYALSGGTARLVPPWGRLGIHSFGPLTSAPRGIEPWGPPGFQGNPPIAKPRTTLSEALAAGVGRINSRIEDFLREMGIDVALRAEASATPFESLRLLGRDEFARFGIDIRDFGETGWRFADKPKPVMFKTFFARSDGEKIVRRNATLRMSCSAGQTINVALVRELAPLEATRPAPLTVRGNGWTFDLSTTTSGYSASPAFRFEMEASVQPAGLVDLLQSAADAGTIEIVSEVPEGSIRWPRSVTLTMDGFSAAYAKLREVCDEPVRTDADCVTAGTPQCVKP